jgi:hypothetical protein
VSNVACLWIHSAQLNVRNTEGALKNELSSDTGNAGKDAWNWTADATEDALNWVGGIFGAQMLYLH